MKEIFDLFSLDKEAFFSRLQLYFGKTLHPRESLVIFDEIQIFPRARELIKFLVKDGRYDYLETGSLISLIENTKDIQIPSEERHLMMYPMTFEEYMTMFLREIRSSDVRISVWTASELCLGTKNQFVRRPVTSASVRILESSLGIKGSPERPDDIMPSSRWTAPTIWSL